MWKITVMYHGGSQSQFIDNKKGEISIQLAKSFYKKYKNTAKILHTKIIQSKIMSRCY